MSDIFESLAWLPVELKNRLATLTDGLESTDLEAGAVATVNLADGAVTAAKIGTGAVVAAGLGALAVGTAALAANAVTTAKLASSAVTPTELASLAVTSPKLAVAVAALVPGTATISIGTEASHVRIVTVTLKDIAGTALTVSGRATCWVSDTAGAAPSGTAPSGGTTVSTGVQLKAVTAGVLLDVISNSSGVIGLTMTEATAKNFYVNVAFGATVVSSAVVAFAG